MNKVLLVFLCITTLIRESIYSQDTKMIELSILGNIPAPRFDLPYFSAELPRGGAVEAGYYINDRIAAGIFFQKVVTRYDQGRIVISQPSLLIKGYVLSPARRIRFYGALNAGNTIAKFELSPEYYSLFPSISNEGWHSLKEEIEFNESYPTLGGTIGVQIKVSLNTGILFEFAHYNLLNTIGEKIYLFRDEDLFWEEETVTNGFLYISQLIDVINYVPFYVNFGIVIKLGHKKM